MRHKAPYIGLGFLGTALIGLLLFFALRGTASVLEPMGVIAAEQRQLFIFTVLLSLLVVIPVFVLTIFIAIRYRAENTKAAYKPDWDHDKRIEFVWWAIPCAIIGVLAVVTWQSTHALDPYRPLESAIKPLNVQVVALPWKWLFLYPELNVASVNYLHIPEQTPINFKITADAPMNSFWIPQLGGQVYAMSGMSTKLHLMAEKPGDFKGSSANLSGEGFADMQFDVRASSAEEFTDWVESVRSNGTNLNNAAYQELAKPSTGKTYSYYSSYAGGLYDTILQKYTSPRHDTNNHAGSSTGSPASQNHAH